MDMKPMHVAALVVLLAIVVYAIWYYYVRKHKCQSSADCKYSQVCNSGYCADAKSS